MCSKCSSSAPHDRPYYCPDKDRWIIAVRKDGYLIFAGEYVSKMDAFMARAKWTEYAELITMSDLTLPKYQQGDDLALVSAYGDIAVRVVSDGFVYDGEFRYEVIAKSWKLPPNGKVYALEKHLKRYEINEEGEMNFDD